MKRHGRRTTRSRSRTRPAPRRAKPRDHAKRAPRRVQKAGKTVSRRRPIERAPVADLQPAILDGVDVSHHNGHVDWDRMAAAGKAYAVMKATDGRTFTDPAFAANWLAAARAGLIRGAYHYFRPAVAPELQADHFAAVVGALTAEDLPPTLDLEERTGWSGTVASRVQTVVSCLARIAERFGRRPILYTSRSFMKECLGSSTALASYPLWVVDYSQDPPRLPAGWTQWTFWQHSESGDAGGVTPIDLDRYRGDLASLRAFIDGSVAPPVARAPVPVRAGRRNRR